MRRSVDEGFDIRSKPINIASSTCVDLVCEL